MTPPQTPDCVVVVPCFNEVSRFSSGYFVEALALLPESRFLFVDDGSTDGTRTLLEQFATSNERASVLALGRNQGKALAVQAGMLRAIDEHPDVAWLAMLDSDGSFVIHDLVCMLAAARAAGIGSRPESLGIVFPSKHAYERPRIANLRSLVGAAASLVLRCGWPDEVPADTQVGLKVMSNNPALRACLATPLRARWFFEWELILRAGPNGLLWVPYGLTSFVRVPGSRIRARAWGRIAGEITYLKIAQLAYRIRRRRSGRS